MGMTSCEDCGHYISDRADVCISCGCPLRSVNDEAAPKSGSG